MAGEQTLRGMATLNFWADDVKAARQWYTELLGIEAYFQRPDAENPAYIEFRLGDYQHELGIVDRKWSPNGPGDGKPGGAILHWHVEDIHAAWEKLLAHGAKPYDPITVRGEGFVTASVVDPFGNVLGIMYNKHYLDILGSKNQ
ncbi:VOC family protein [Dyadobacter sp. LJ53]|uniref:VOC family protein n=1 Tax=Dyadobacter chenwenxiniae TaxID=2906456 RepID=UPI001F47CEAA|nr:VOC family protein [Dyadobacter chenwenxiniae]MCF0050572.1 VOC family protein [Dyadobacter chenwenxiniae]